MDPWWNSARFRQISHTFCLCGFPMLSRALGPQQEKSFFDLANRISLTIPTGIARDVNDPFLNRQRVASWPICSPIASPSFLYLRKNRFPKFQWDFVALARSNAG